ncbi:MULTISPECIES: permease [unclassified Photobacterium]|uniref:permease n=1 Tax=unclassified Photobacterium TaxID=2628852 RepID=UPI001EDE428D|nr:MULTISPECIES: permease [unclassified Photobacterium]MCG3864497.1 permease [Photobacterium sp. Ph6]MCG3876610.1 permease [Photobacterium sp. Ph5]
MNSVKISFKDSLVGAVINAVINYFVAAHAFADKLHVPMSLDLISTTEVSVWGQAVSLSFGLGAILSFITAKIFSSHTLKQAPYLQPQISAVKFSSLLSISLNNTMFLFGWFVALAVLWTHYFGVILVPVMYASFIVAALAFFVTILVEQKTKSSLLQRWKEVV